MALATTTALGLGLGALGGYMNARSQNAAARQQQAWQQMMMGQLGGMRQSGPGAAERQLAELLGGGMPQFQQGDLGQLLGQGFNTGQDGLMQMLRADPRTKVDQTLEGIVAAQGNPFDTSGLFEALGAQDRRGQSQAARTLGAQTSGLGQRFGSASAGAQAQLLQGMAQDHAARNAQIQMGSFESAQGRLAQALAMMGGREQQAFGNQLAAAQALQQGALGAGQLGLGVLQQNNAAQQQGFGNQAQLLQMLLGAEQGRMQNNLGLMQLMGGLGAPQGAPGYGGFLSGLGTLALFQGMMGQQQNKKLPGGGAMLGWNALPQNYIPGMNWGGY